MITSYIYSKGITDTKKVVSYIAPVIAIALFYEIISLIGTGCPIKYLTGISCAGCGMTRAWRSVIQLDFISAFHYHTLFWSVIPVIILYLLKDRLPDKVKTAICVIYIVVFVGVYIWRMFDPTQDIVTFNPTGGLLYKFYAYLMQTFL